MCLNPFPPTFYLQHLSIGYHLLGRYEDAIEGYKRLLKRSPDNVIAHINLTAAYSALGREEEARHEAEEVLKLDPEFSLEQWVETCATRDKAECERWLDHLRKAGLK
jgi:tetratricopeptide (TPR) repeat protein